MRRFVIVSCALLALASCKKDAPPEAPPPAAAEAPPPEVDKCARIDTLAQLMDCKLAPYAKGGGDEAAFNRVLAQLRELAPPDSGFNEGQRPWFAIVDDMMAKHDAKQGCAECHRSYMKAYRERYKGSAIVFMADAK